MVIYPRHFKELNTVLKYLPDQSEATVLGHQKQEMSNLQTTKLRDENQEDLHPEAPVPNVRQQEVA